MFEPHSRLYEKTVGWLRMKLGLWEPLTAKGESIHSHRSGHDNRLRRVPGWVIKASADYYESYQGKNGVRPYDETKYFTGNSFVYRVHFDAVAQGEIRERVYRKLKASPSSRLLSFLNPF